MDSQKPSRAEPKDYAHLWLDGGGDPTFDQIDGFLLAHFNARAVYVEDGPPTETETLRKALIDAYHAMDAACRWAAGETAGVKTIADADRHTAGYDALLHATVKAGQTAGILLGGTYVYHASVERGNAIMQGYAVESPEHD